MLKLISILFLSTLMLSQGNSEIGIREKSISKTYYKNADVYLNSTTLIKNATIVVENGVIQSVKKNGAVDNAYEVIDLSGKTVYPGFIDAFSEYGLSTKKEKNESSNDSRQGLTYWNGSVHSEKVWYKEFKTSKGEATGFLKNGFTVVHSAKHDGLFRGKSFITLVGDDIENDLLLEEENAHFLSFNNGSHRGYPGSLMGKMALIRQTLNDASWYVQARKAYELNPNQKPVEHNAALAGLSNIKNSSSFFDSGDISSLFRADRLFSEYKYPIIHIGSGAEYTRINDLKNLKRSIVVPVLLTKKPSIETLEDEVNVELGDLRHWERAKTNLKELEHAKINFALTTAKLKKSSDFFKNLGTYVKAGFSKSAALKALTETPAKLLKMNHLVGTLNNGKLANFVITDGDLFDGKNSILATVVRGKRTEFKPLNILDIRANYSFRLSEKEYSLNVAGEANKLSAKLMSSTDTLKVKSIEISSNKVNFSFSAEKDDLKGKYKFSGRYDESSSSISGYILDENANKSYVKLNKVSGFEKMTEKEKSPEEPEKFVSTLSYPNVSYGVEKAKKVETVLYKNFTIWTSENKFELKNTDLLIEDGKIEKIGKNLSAPKGAKVIHGEGKYLTTGIIDQHSHIAISGGFNEWHSVSAEVTIADVVDAQDISIYRQLAGGVTTSQLLHGSADPIGGRSQIIKLRWGKTSEDLKFKKAAQNIKFALGENVKRSPTRYPNTRMGVETVMRDAFQAAVEYRDEWKKYNDLSSSEKRETVRPKKDVQKEVLVDILEGRTFVHCHSYVQSEIIMLMRLAEEFGFKVHTFTHILEGYKVADEMRKHGAMASTFSDWWAYKYEVKDAMAYNATLMHDKGLIVSVNSDDAELGRRLNIEAAKSMVHGNMSQEDAWRMVTLNPAKQLQVDKFTGSLKEGKDADIVVWNTNPLSIYSKVEAVWVDGVNYFNLEDDKKVREAIKAEKIALIKKAQSDKSSGKGKRPVKKMKSYFKCEDQFQSAVFYGGLND